MSLNPLSRRPPRRRKRAVSMAAAGLLLGGAAAVARRVGLGRARSDAGGSSAAPAITPGAPHTPEPSNYDVGGPPANTATHVPVPAPAVPQPIDEEAEVAAAATEAAGIGGVTSAYASSDRGEVVDEEERPLVEAGEGVSEGMEQAEAELVDAAEPFDTASPYQQQIDEVIEQQDNPYAGEREEAMDAAGEPVDFDQPGDDLGASATGASSERELEEPQGGSSSERDDRP